MGIKGFSLEQKFEVWNDNCGEKIEVGPDRDGLDLIELRSFNSDNKIDGRMSFTKEQAVLIAKAINALAGS